MHICYLTWIYGSIFFFWDNPAVRWQPIENCGQTPVRRKVANLSRLCLLSLLLRFGLSLV